LFNRFKNFRDISGILIVLLSSLFFAIVPNAAKLALDDGSSLMILLLSRYLIGFIFLIPLMFFSRKSILIPKELTFVTFLSCIFSILLVAATYSAVKFTSVGLVFLILYLFPIGVALISYFRGKEKITFFQWICIIFISLGLSSVVFDGVFNGNLLGIVISFAGLFCFIIFIILSGYLVSQLGSIRMNFHNNFLGLIFLGIILMFPFNIPMELPNSNLGWFAISANGIFYIVSWVLFFEGLRIIGVTRASVLTTTDPLFAAIIALLFLNQNLTIIQWVGFTIVILSIYFFERHKSKL